MSKFKKFLNSKAGKLVSSFAVGALKGVTGPVGGMIGGAFDGVKGEILEQCRKQRRWRG
jgi:hypothetical protein